MCLFEFDQEQAMKSEREEGIKEGEIRLLVKWVKAGKFTVDEAAEEAGITVEEFKKILAEN